MRRLALMQTAFIATLLLASGIVVAQSPMVPDALMPPKGNVLLVELRAEGFQVYTCKPKSDDPKAFEWVLTAPDAVLYDERGDRAGIHGAGPHWMANDGSKIIAAKSASTPAPGGKTIPWLLLKVKSHEGKGIFSNVTYLQRVDTWAGVAPGASATKENVGKELRVKYQATYRFFGPKP